MKRIPCDGQVGYVSTRIDGAVENIIKEYLARIKTTPKTFSNVCGDNVPLLGV